MKNILTFLLVLFISTVAVAQQPVQRSLITKRTATWCVNCGTWGWNFFEGLAEDNKEKAVLIRAHYSGDLQNNYSKELTENFGSVGQPNFFVGENRVNATSSNYPTQREEVKNMVDVAHAQMPIANTMIAEGDTQNSTITMTARTKFFQAAEGNFHLSVLLIEDNVMNKQSGQGGTVAHDGILRSAATANVFGESIASGTIASGTEIMTPFEINIDPNWNKLNLRLAFVIWKKNGDKFEFVNAQNAADIFNIETSAAFILPKSAYTLTSNLTTDYTQLTIGSKEVNGQVKVVLYDIIGNAVKNIWNGEIVNSTVVAIERTDLPAGTYLLKIEIDNKVATEKIVFLR